MEFEINGGFAVDERKLKILSAVVEQYIITGEPVGSKSLMESLDINVSPATIRNEMAALEQLGFLEQPHRITSYNVCYTKLLRIPDFIESMVLAPITVSPSIV